MQFPNFVAYRVRCYSVLSTFFETIVSFFEGVLSVLPVHGAVAHFYRPPEHYHLLCINQNTQEAHCVLPNVKIIEAAAIIWVRREDV